MGVWVSAPLAIDLYCGLGGWTEGLLAEGYDVVGFDIERHQYGEHRYPAQLVVQDVLTLHGSQFKNAALIVASPPCQEYSYMAMPWKLAKAKAAAIRADTTGQMLADLNRLFEACFRIQAQASLAAGRHVPMVVENVRGAIPWVGRSRWNFGSFHLWGDVPALMPNAGTTMKFGKICHSPEDWSRVQKGERIRHPHTINPDARLGVKHHGSAVWFDTGPASLPSSSPRRKEASAMIAKIPLPLSRHIAAVYRA
jgi:C-5 cytosine-specific DNA methylase